MLVEADQLLRVVEAAVMGVGMEVAILLHALAMMCAAVMIHVRCVVVIVTAIIHLITVAVGKYVVNVVIIVIVVVQHPYVVMITNVMSAAVMMIVKMMKYVPVLVIVDQRDTVSWQGPRYSWQTAP